MKRVVIVTILLLLGKLLLAQTPMYSIEIYLDGNPVSDFSILDAGDIEWKMTNKSASPEVFVTKDEVGDWSLDPYGLDGTSLPTFTLNLQELYNKKPIVGGETLLFEVSVVTGPYAGYSGSVTFITTAEDNDLTGAKGVNLTGAAKKTISVSPNPLAFCEKATSGASTKLKATITGGDGTETVTWELAAGGAITGVTTTGYEADFSGCAVGTYTVVAKCGDLTSEEVTVTVNPIPTVTLAAVNKEGCYGTDKFTLTATPGTGAATDYKYTWSGVSGSGASIADIAFPQGSKAYSVIAESAAGCKSKPATASVTGHYATVTIAGPTQVFHSATADLTATVTPSPATDAVKSYAWSKGGTTVAGATTNKITTDPITGETTYTVEVTTGELGCKSTASHKITVNGDELNVVAKGVTACAGADMQLLATPSGGQSSKYEYTWKPSAGLVLSNVNAQNPLVDKSVPAGTYTATVELYDGITRVISEPVTVVVKPVPVLTDIKATPSNVYKGGTSDLEVKVAPTTGVSLKWGPDIMIAAGKTTITAKTTTLQTTTTFTVEADMDGCKDTEEVTVTVLGEQLVATATGGSGCAGTAISAGVTTKGGSGAKITYNWKPSAGLTFVDNTAQNPVVKNTVAAGTYTAICEVTQGDDEPVKSNEVNIIVKRVPVLSGITANPSSGTNTVTPNLSVTVDPTTAKMKWQPENLIASGLTTANAVARPLTETTTFTVTADLDGCSAEDQVTVTVNKQELTGLTVTGAEGCAGTTMSLSAEAIGGVPEITYQWGSSTPAGVVLSNTSAQKPTITNSGELSGSYTIPVTATDANGQTKSGSAVITVYPKLEVTGSGFCKDASTFDGQIDVTNGTAPYVVYSDMACTQVVNGVQWTGNQGKISNLLSGTNYTYYIKDKNGCNNARVTLSADCACGAQLTMITGTKACAGTDNEIEIILQASGGSSYSFDVVNVELGTKVKEVRNEAGPQWKVPIRYADRGKYRVDNFKAVTDQSAPGACDGNVTPTWVDVQFYPTPVVNAGEDKLVCGTEKIILKGSGDPGLTYTWDNGVTDGQEFNPVLGMEREYTVTGTDGNGCTNTDKVKVAAYEKPNVAASATPNVICKGEAVTLVQNGDAHVYEWDNGGLTGANNFPETTTRYTLKGTNSTTGCSDTSSVVVTVNLPAEITDRPKDRTIAIGRDVNFKIGALGNNLVYEWKWYNKNSDTWQSFTNTTTGTPKVSGANTEELLLEGVPQSWDNTKVKCVVKGDCGAPAEAEAMLYVKECFDIAVDLKMKEGIRPADSSEENIDGWYCKGNRIALQALVSLTDPGNGSVENPHFTWTIDGLPNSHVIESDSSVLSWIPEYWEDDIVVKVCAYSDGACTQVCSRHLRLKARTPDDVRMQIVTSVDPLRMFCPGDTIDFTVAMSNDGRNSNIHWYRDIFDKGMGRSKTFVMDQKDTWVRAVFEPSEEMCVESTVQDSVFLRVKEYVTPTLRIDNNIHDTIACQGDTLLFQAFWTNAGTNPQITWRQDIWDRGYGEYASIGLNDKDTWVKCILVPGEDVCYSGPTMIDTMVIRVREAGTLTIATDMTDKHPGDELTFVSTVEGMSGTWNYSWYVDNRLTDCEEKDYITDELKQGDIVQAAIGGNEVCINKIFSNKIVVDYDGYVNRDTMITIYKGETVKDVDMMKSCDEAGKVLFMIETPAMYGMATISPDGKFTYIPNNGFVGTDWVKYVVMNRSDRTIIAEGYIYVTVKDNNRFLVPNLITPNDDGLNDTWKLDFLVDYPEHKITVYNRDGQVVFTASNYQNDWDGTGYTKGSYVGQINLMNGVYTYVIELGDKDKTVLKSWVEIRANLNRRSYR